MNTQFINPKHGTLINPKRPDNIASEFLKITAIKGFPIWALVRDKWYAYTGTHWEEILPLHLRSVLSTFLRGCVMESKEGEMPVEPTPAVERNVLHMLEDRCYHPEVTIPFSFLKKEADYISFNNGLYDLNDLKLFPHTPTWFDVEFVDRDYTDSKECTEWLAVLDKIFDGNTEIIGHLQELAGYGLTSNNAIEQFWIFHGKSRGGKGTITDTLTAMWGRHNVASPSVAVLTNRFGLQGLVGKRVCVLPDVTSANHQEITKFQELVKTITGGGGVDIEEKFKNTRSNISLTCKFIFVCNVLPRFIEKSNALEDRVIIVPFMKSFAHEQDWGLKSRLLKELPGITNWAIEGLQKLMSRKQFQIPEVCKYELGLFGNSLSPIKTYTQENCETGILYRTRKQEIYDDYRMWCLKNGNSPVSNNKLLPELRSVDMEIGEMTSGGKTYYTNIRLKGQDDHTSVKSTITGLFNLEKVGL